MRSPALEVERTRLLSVVVVSTFCLSAMLGLLSYSSMDGIHTEVRESPAPAKTLALTSHAPILIDGNGGFTNASGVVWGSGTESDSYIIEDWDINASTANGIEIWNTDVHFIVRTCFVHDGNLALYPYFNGIRLRNCSNGTLDGNNCSNSLVGILVSIESGPITISNNFCSDNGKGICLYSSSDCYLTWNQIRDNSGYGVFIFQGSYDCRMWGNSFYHNNGAGDTYDSAHVQAYDDGFGGNWWNSTDGYGNYWSDWTTPDNDSDGIVDNPYVLDGSAGAKDYYPLTTTPCEQIPEFGIMPFVMMVLLVVIVLTVGARRRKAH